MKLRIIINALRKLHASKQTYIYVSCAAYYLIISFIPMTLLFFSIMSFLPFASNLEILIQQLLPEGFSDLLYKIMDWIRKKRSVSLLSISGLVTIWSASKSMMYVSTGLDHVMNISSREKRLQTRLRAIYTLLPLPFLLYTIFIFYIIISIASQKVLSALLPGFADVIFSFNLYSILLLSVVFAIFYRIVPSHRFPFRNCIRSAVVTAILWSVSANVFSIYVKYISSYPFFYGIIGFVYLGMIWLHFSIRIVFLGGRIVYLQANDLYHPLQTIRKLFSE